MRDFVNPRDTQPSVTEAFRQIRLILKDLDFPLLSKKSSVKGITEGTSAYFFEGSTLCRYTKMKGKLYKETIGDLDAPVETEAPEIFYSSTFGRETP